MLKVPINIFKKYTKKHVHGENLYEFRRRTFRRNSDVIGYTLHEIYNKILTFLILLLAQNLLSLFQELDHQGIDI